MWLPHEHSVLRVIREIQEKGDCEVKARGEESQQNTDTGLSNDKGYRTNNNNCRAKYAGRVR